MVAERRERCHHPELIQDIWVPLRRPCPPELQQLPAPLVGPLAETVRTDDLLEMNASMNSILLNQMALKIVFVTGLIGSSDKKPKHDLSLRTLCRFENPLTATLGLP